MYSDLGDQIYEMTFRGHSSWITTLLYLDLESNNQLCTMSLRPDLTSYNKPFI